MSNEYDFKQLNPKLNGFLILNLVYKRKVNEVVKIILSDFCDKIVLNMKEHILSQDHFKELN